MGKGCIAVTKYFLFLFNLLFFVSITFLHYCLVAVVQKLDMHSVHCHMAYTLSASLFAYDRKIGVLRHFS